MGGYPSHAHHDHNTHPSIICLFYSESQSCLSLNKLGFDYILGGRLGVPLQLCLNIYGTEC